MERGKRGGQSRGRGRGDDRGDRGGGRGARGGGRGAYRGDSTERGGSRGGHWGGNQGASRGDAADRGGSRGRGGGRGGYQGGHDDRGRGGRGGRGGGGFRGRGGHFGGDPYAGQEHYFGETTASGQLVGELDQATQQLEDRLLTSLTRGGSSLGSRMARLSVAPTSAGTSSSSATSVVHFPQRPAFGSLGTKVALWANYFQVEVGLDTVHKYDIKVSRIFTPSTKSDAPGPSRSKKETKASGADTGPDPPSPSPGTSGPARRTAEVRGPKLRLVIEAAIRQLQQSEPAAKFASEYKSQLVSTVKLQNTAPIKVRLEEDDSDRSEDFEVKVEGYTEARIGDLMNYLRTMVDNSSTSFPKFEVAAFALNIIMGNFARNNADVSVVGSMFYNCGGASESQEISRFNPLLAVRGYYQSVRMSTGRLLVNTNVTHGVFLKPIPFTQLFVEYGIDAREVSPRMQRRIRDLAKFVSRIRVEWSFKNQQGRDCKKARGMLGIASRDQVAGKLLHSAMGPKFQTMYPSPAQVDFFLEVQGEGKNEFGFKSGRITVAEYYRRRYGQVLDERFPVLNLGTREKPTFVPAENCTILPGQSAKMKLTGQETSSMLDFACRTPFANAFSVTHGGRETLGFDGNQTMRDFDIRVGKELLLVSGRELPPPKLAYMAKSVSTQLGRWNLVGNKFVRPCPPITHWTWVEICYPGRGGDPEHTKGTVNAFIASLSANGLSVSANAMAGPRRVDWSDEDTNLARNSPLKQWFTTFGAQRPKPQIALIVLPAEDSGIYGVIKRLGDLEGPCGFHTVCVVANKFAKRNPMYFANLALKWNLKMGGANHSLSDRTGILQGGKTMIVGYDVSHPTNVTAKEGRDLPSLVGLVASVDSELAQWPAVSWQQTGGKEILDGDLLYEGFKTRLNLWLKRNRQYPENIVIFRDGVSEGQFQQVLDLELPSIRKACLGLGARIKISIIVSVKRHQTRFYPTSFKDADTTHRNIKPGTVVDRGVTQARYWDFFLTAHDALKGTARPAHYTVLLDEVFRLSNGGNGRAAVNELEKLTHDLCYLFGRATRSVSICPPAYYADIVCERARVHQWEAFSDDASTAPSTSTAGSSLISSKNIHPDLQDTMYYI